MGGDPVQSGEAYDDAIAGRAVSSTAAIMAVVSVGAAAASHFDVESEALAVGNLVLATIYLGAIAMNRASRIEIARWMVIGGSALHAAMAWTTFGAQSGFDFYLVGMSFIPLVLFPHGWRRIAIAYGVYAATVAASASVLATHGPLLVVAAGPRARGYFVTLVFITVLVGGVLNAYRRSSRRLREQLASEKARADRLVQRMLPEKVSALLLGGARRVAERRESATIVFADLVGFSRFARGARAEQVVDVLDELFCELDKLALAHGIEKIKTIGDCYMAAAGVVAGDTGDPARAADFALAMAETTRCVAQAHGAPQLAVRIGMAHGPVIAGVIGRDRPVFDVWGETVNLASRMESSGKPGAVHVSGELAARLAHTHLFEECDPVTVRGWTSPVISAFMIGRRSDDHTEPVP